MLLIVDNTSDSHDDHEDNKRDDDYNATFTALFQQCKFVISGSSRLQVFFLKYYKRHEKDIDNMFSFAN